MADSNITKRALSMALKALMEEQPFSKINVGDICEKCDMNRKSFYYHFKDKYDLVNWTFDTEFISAVNMASIQAPLDERWEEIERACCYFYENRTFYRSALKITGQNSFSEHLRAFCFPLMKLRISAVVGEEAADDFSVNFFTDACLSAIVRWLSEKDCMPPDEFVDRLKKLVYGGAAALYQELGQN